MLHLHHPVEVQDDAFPIQVRMHAHASM